MQHDGQCVIMKAGRYVESAHIYSFSMCEHLVPRAQRLFALAKTEILENRIMMAKTVHSAWDHCECAFKPIQTAGEKTSMVVQFFWLKYRDYGRALASLLETPDHPSGRGDLKFWLPFLWPEYRVTPSFTTTPSALSQPTV